MDKIDFDKVYYHSIESMHTIRLKLMSDESIKKLESILESGYIYSRRNLEEKHIKVGYNNFNFNGLDYISICKKKSSFTTLESVAYRYVREGTTLILSEKIKEDLTFKEYPRAIEGEEQVKDKIPISYIIGLSLPIPKDFEEKYYKEVLYAKALLVKHNLHVPIFNIRDNNKEIFVSKSDVKNMLKTL